MAFRHTLPLFLLSKMKIKWLTLFIPSHFDL
ncbi:Uncharacterised protein [Serratia quinivorans]|nr:Uncharacterised protein [Serratia quinivorans]